MKVRDEINCFSKEDDKPILLGLLSKYHWSSQWRFVAEVRFNNTGPGCHNRVWLPTEAGRVLYEHLICSEESTHVK